MKSPCLNPWVSALEAPAIPTVAAWAHQYDGRLGPMLGFSQAVPGYPPPPALLAALAQAAGDVQSCGYGDIEGEWPLRQAYAQWASTLYRAPIEAAQVQITAGCNQAFFVAMQALCHQGDRVALVEPYYFNHQTTLASMGVDCLSVPAHAADGFLPRIEAVQAALRQGARALVLISPNNPTGAIYPPALIAALFEACQHHGAWLVLDETYRDFIDLQHTPAHDLPTRCGWQDHAVLLYSFSKSFCVPGHRVGAIVTGQRLMDELAKIVDNLQICAPRAPQLALAQVIAPLAAWREANRAEIARRADALRQALQTLPRWQLAACGAYFAFLRHPFATLNSVQAAQRLAIDHGVLTIPGEFFGPAQRAYLRLAFANADVPTIAQIGPRLQGA